MPRAGIIINVTSSVTLAPFPLVACYTASKAAIEGFTASLELELKDFDVRVKLVEPGYGPSTSFTSNGQQRIQGLIPKAYEPFAHSVFAGYAKVTEVTKETDVADAVLKAASDVSRQLRFAAGADALALV
jgi:NAD(P)-dependent dehydrogenase (short-subunit alcohol dehydrogenase family)